MKIVAVDNRNKDVADRLIASGVNEYIGTQMVRHLNSKSDGIWFYKLVDDDYTLNNPFVVEFHPEKLPLLTLLYSLVKKGFEIKFSKTEFCAFAITMDYYDKDADTVQRIKRLIGEELGLHRDPEYLVKDTLTQMSAQLLKEVNK